MSATTHTNELSIVEAVSRIQDGRLKSEQIVLDCLAVIDASEGQLHAWQWLDRDQALERARALDDLRRRGYTTGALHGIPIGLKDIIDTSDMPTERGSPIYSGRRPDASAATVERLLEAGAVILGKTVTTEFAYMHPSKTRNPHHVAYSPGGSSSGSAAAVGAGQIPAALGTQTNGSVIRPASYCGVFGFKPSAGLVSRRGILQTSATLDQVGVFARHAEDLALVADVLSGYDPLDASSKAFPAPLVLAGWRSEVPIEPSLAWIDMPYRDRYSQALQLGAEQLLQTLGTRVERLTAPQSFAALVPCHKVIYDYEIWRCLEAERSSHREQLSATALKALDVAGNVTEAQYREALEIRQTAIDWFARFFYDYDAILSPSATGEAPRFDSGTTGDPVCNTVWTLCGLPCLSMPLLTGNAALPIGIQLIGDTRRDDRLFRTAHWLLDYLRPSDDA